MVKRVFGFLYKETSTLHSAAYLLAFFAVMSQVLAFVRDRLLAHIFGAGADLDMYYAAFRIPDFIFVTAASVVSISVLVPFIVEKEKESGEGVKRFLDNMFSFFSVLIIAVCAVAYFLIPAISEVLFAGFTDTELREVTVLSRILLLSPVFLGISNLFGSITQSHNRFAVYAIAPLLYNASIILGTIALSGTMGIRGVVIGVVSGSFLHMLVQVPFVVKTGLLPRFRAGFDLASIRKVVAISLPRTLTLSLSHIAALFLVSAASLMAVGSISVFSFAFNIQSVPLSVIAVSYSLAAFPSLARYFSEKNISAFMTQMATTARHIVFWSLPATALFVVLRAQIVRVLLGSGEFDWSDTRLTAASLALFAVSAVFQGLILLFIRGFYAAGSTRKPLLINTLSTLLIIGLSYGLVGLFEASSGFRYFIGALLKVEDIAGTVVLMLPLGFTLGTLINGIAHWMLFGKYFRGWGRDVVRTFLESFAVSVIMGYVAYLGLGIFAPVFNTETLMGIFLQGFLAGVLGIIAGIIIFILLKNREFAEAWTTIHTKFWKSKVIAGDPEIV